MRHYGIADWTDFVRNVAPDTLAAPMRRHLEAGCGRCSRTRGTLERVADAARFERRSTPPEHALRSVKALFALESSRAAPRSTIRLSLAFDSYLTPAPAGSRTLHDSTRQLLFQSEEYALDLRIDSCNDARELMIVGQLLERRGEPVADVPAFLIARGRPVGTAITNELGGFQLEGPKDGSHELQLVLDGERRLAVQVDA